MILIMDINDNNHPNARTNSGILEDLNHSGKPVALFYKFKWPSEGKDVKGSTLLASARYPVRTCMFTA